MFNKMLLLKIENSVNATTTNNVAAVKEKQPKYENEAIKKEALSPNIAEKMTESLNKFLETTSTKLRYEIMKNQTNIM